jgi:plastocyanin
VRTRSLAAALVLLGAAAALFAANRSVDPASHVVVIESMTYTPATLSIRAGDSVTWINKDLVAHTATTSASSRRSFDSGTIEPAKSWSHTFTDAGRSSYICTFHPTMQAAVEITK